MKAEQIPHLVDSQAQFFFWEIDEVVPFGLMLVLGILVGALLTCVLLALGVTYVYRRYKQRALEGVLLHMGYWNGIYTLNKKFNNGMARDFEQ